MDINYIKRDGWKLHNQVPSTCRFDEPLTYIDSNNKQWILFLGGGYPKIPHNTDSFIPGIN